MFQHINSRGRRYLLAIAAASAFLAFGFNLKLYFGGSRGRGGTSPGKDGKWSEVSFDYETKSFPLVPVSEIDTIPASTSNVATPATPIPEPNSIPPHPAINNNQCINYDNTTSLIVVLKTGATEAFSRLPPSLLTFLQCPISTNSLLLFSDMAQDIGLHHIYDSLDTVTPSVSSINNSEFNLYRDQYAAIASGQTISSLSNRGSDAWKLDKYKNIHMAQKSWDMRPGRDWYFFIDADTYVFFPTLWSFLKRYDPNEKWYLGSSVKTGSFNFAHGGSGYIVSRAAMEVLVEADRKELAAKSDEDTSVGCCGDESFAQALLWKGVSVTNVRPIIQGDKLDDIAFGDRWWCQPLLTTHHVSPEDINIAWGWEQRREKPGDPVIISELFSTFTPPLIPSKDNWHNGIIENSISPPQNAPDFKFKHLKFMWDWYDWWVFRPWQSFDTCKTACHSDPACLTFMHFGQTCVTSPIFKEGRKRDPEGEIVYRSGWDLGRIERWRLEKGTCDGYNWTPNDE